MNKKYNLKLDLQFRCNNSTMKFNQFDNNTSDFFMRITNGGNLVDIEKAIVVLAIIKPSGKVASQFVEVENGLVYADLKPNMKDEIGIYTAQAMLILEDERVVTDSISYEVEEDKIFSLLNDSVRTSEEFTLLTDMLNRLSTIETSEEQRVINEAERILSEENRKIEEAKRVEAELIRQHEEADRAKYDATRESNENIRKQNESIRLANEANRIDEEAKRVEEEAKRVEAEQLRKDNYNFMTEDEERRRSEANAHKEAEVLRVQAETNRVNEEAKRRTIEQARVSAENTRVSNENTREANELSRKNNETQRVEAETQRQSRYNSFIADAEANANNFENYTNTAKVKEEERKSNELDRKSQEDRRISNEVERISNENTRKANEVVREKNETSRQNIFEDKVDEFNEKIVELNTTKENFVSSINTKVDNKISEIEVAKSDMTTTVSNKVNEVETRFNALTSKQQQDAEVIDARDGETSLKARLDRDIEKAKQVYVNVEGSHISTDSSVGYAKDVEILGNTIQDASNLADIRSVGDKVEGQELYEIDIVSRGKNLFNPKKAVSTTGTSGISVVSTNSDMILKSTSGAYNMFPINYILKPNTDYVLKGNRTILNGKGRPYCEIRDTNGNLLSSNGWTLPIIFRTDNTGFVKILFGCNDNENNASIRYYDIQLEEGTVATPYEPYVEDKLTILSPVQLERVGDVADRIIEKDGVWGVEKNVKDFIIPMNLSWDSYTSNIPAGAIGGYCTVNMDDFDFIVKEKDYHAISEKNVVLKGNSVSPLSAIGMFLRPDTKNIYIKDNVATLTDMKLKYEGSLIKYPTLTPQFIPLPHDQQVKLRTFANKTNISFLTEIEGTIKAQVPKSLGATVNTHTEQISNLNKELDRVKKLEESTVSTVETESDFTTVEATSNGYFEDVKLEGKTLVTPTIHPLNEIENRRLFHLTNLKTNTIYTIINPTDILIAVYKYDSWIDPIKNGYFNGNFIFNTLDNERATVYFDGDVVPKGVFVVEGDHTQNPPSFFEGLKSVGDTTDEIVVSSVKGDGNLIPTFDGFIVENNFNNSVVITDTKIEGIPSAGGFRVIKPTYLNEGSYTCSTDGHTGINARVRILNTDRSIKITNVVNQSFTIDKSGLYIISIENNGNTETSFSIEGLYIYKYGKQKPDLYSYQSDKKRLLYYNNETQTWEKPILRQWDSIEKHADGKYYYHQRSGEVVFNGSENWLYAGGQSNTDTSLFYFNISTRKPSSIGICDKFIQISNYTDKNIEGVFYGTDINIRIDTSKLSTQDATGFKQWLQANNVTVVYQLAEEKVYECTNIDLITYANETNYIVESGVIVPKTILKVHNNISNVVSLLQKKVSLLESNIKASQEVQDMMILETDMRMLDIELALMEFIPMTLNLGGSNMLRSATYFNFLKNHIINETYEKEYLENVMNKYLATGRINQDEYNELYKMLYPPVYDIELPIEY